MRKYMIYIIFLHLCLFSYSNEIIEVLIKSENLKEENRDFTEMIISSVENKLINSGFFKVASFISLRESKKEIKLNQYFGNGLKNNFQKNKFDYIVDLEIENEKNRAKVTFKIYEQSKNKAIYTRSYDLYSFSDIKKTSNKIYKTIVHLNPKKYYTTTAYIKKGFMHVYYKDYYYENFVNDSMVNDDFYLEDTIYLAEMDYNEKNGNSMEIGTIIRCAENIYGKVSLGVSQNTIEYFLKENYGDFHKNIDISINQSWIDLSASLAYKVNPFKENEWSVYSGIIISDIFDSNYTVSGRTLKGTEINNENVYLNTLESSFNGYTIGFETKYKIFIFSVDYAILFEKRDYTIENDYEQIVASRLSASLGISVPYYFSDDKYEELKLRKLGLK